MIEPLIWFAVLAVVVAASVAFLRYTLYNDN